MRRRSWVAYSLALGLASVPLYADVQKKLSESPAAAPRASAEVFAAVNRGRVLRNQRNFDAAQAALEEVLAKARAGKDRAGEVLALINLASVYRYRAGLNVITEKQLPPADLIDKAVKLYEPALGIARETNYKPNEAYASLYLGVLSAARGEHDKAFTQYEEALKLYQAIDDPFYVAHTNMYMGATALYRKQQPALALKYFEAALPKYREIGHWADAQLVIRDMDKAYQQLISQARGSE